VRALLPVVAIVLLGVPACFEVDDARDPALARGARDLACRASELEVVRRDDLGPDLMEVRGCGHVVLYACPHDARFACSPAGAPSS
jgi:hypothetical protein